MAKKLNAETAAEVGHNQLGPAERAQMIEEVISDLQLLDKQRREFNSKAALKRKSITSMVRGQLGYTMKVFMDEFMRPFEEKNDHENQEAWDLRMQAKAEAAHFLKIGEQMTLFGQQAAATNRAERARQQNGKPKPAGGRKGAAKKTAENPDDDAPTLDGFDDHPDTIDVASDKGYDAGKSGRDKKTNPYENGSRHYQAWNTGWVTAQGELARKIGPTPQSAAVN